MVYSVKVGTQDVLLCRILDVADGIGNRQQATRAIHSRMARCVTAEGGVFENLLQAHASKN